jgi:hypothetical protein
MLSNNINPYHEFRRDSWTVRRHFSRRCRIWFQARQTHRSQQKSLRAKRSEHSARGRLFRLFTMSIEQLMKHYYKAESLLLFIRMCFMSGSDYRRVASLKLFWAAWAPTAITRKLRHRALFIVFSKCLRAFRQNCLKRASYSPLAHPN